MAEQIKELDARVSADGASSHFVVFAARKTPGVGVGHAFVVWGKEDQAQAMSSQKAFGFYPSALGQALLGLDVPGDVINEATKPPYGALLTARLIVRVGKAEFDSSQREIATWDTSDYNLYGRNCVSFAHAVAKDIGLLGMPDPSATLPVDYFESLLPAVLTAYGGNWRTDDANQRFGLQIADGSFKWTEHGAGAEHVINVVGSEGSTVQAVKLERPNTDSVLKFLGFGSASLRQQILAAGPEPSSLTLSRSGDELRAVWRGLLVRKKPDGSLAEIVQPSDGTPKDFVFRAA